MKKLLQVVGILVVAVVAYLALWPVPIQPVAWDAPAAPGYTGPHAANTKLANLQMIDLKGEIGPEHIVIAGESAGAGLTLSTALSLRDDGEPLPAGLARASAQPRAPQLGRRRLGWRGRRRGSARRGEQHPGRGRSSGQRLIARAKIAARRASRGVTEGGVDGIIQAERTAVGHRGSVRAMGDPRGAHVEVVRFQTDGAVGRSGT